MEDLNRLATSKHFHHRIVQQDGDLAFIAGRQPLVDALVALLHETAERVLEVNPDQLEIEVRGAR